MLSFKEYCDKVLLNVTTLLTERVSDTYGASRASSAAHRVSTEFVFLHTTGNNASAKNEALNLKNNAGGGQSFNAVADKDGVYETVAFANVAHHAGNKWYNVRSLGFELVDSEQDKGYENYVKYIGYVMAQIGLVPSDKTILWHTEAGVSTSCGKYLKGLGKDRVVSDIKHFYEIALGKTLEEVKPEPAPKPKPTPKPTPAPKPTPKPSGYKVVAENGYFKPDRTVLIKNEPFTSHAQWGQQAAGDEFEYDAYTVNDGHIWVRSKKLQKWVPWRVAGGTKFGSVRLKGQAAPAPKPKPKAIAVGDKVRTNATKDIHGVRLDKHTINPTRTFEVIQIGRNGNKNQVLLGGVYTWVDLSTLTRA